MNNKKLLLPIVLVLLIAIVAVAVWLIGDNNLGNTDKMPLAEKLFRVYSCEELSQLSKDEKFQIEQMDGHHIVRDIDAFDEKMSYVFLFNEDDSLADLSASSKFDAKNAEAFQKKAEGFMQALAAMFDRNADSFYAYSSDGVYDSKDAATFVKVFDGEAVIEFRIRDMEGTCWIMKIQNTGEQFLCTIDHSINNPAYDALPMNIDLS